MFDTLLNNLIWSEGFPFLILLLFCMFVGYRRSRALFYGSSILLLFCFYFFRNPERVCVDAMYDPKVIVCPADGKVMAIDRASLPEGYGSRVAIFLSPLDVHVNWVPVGGMIEDVTYRPGKFLGAYKPESSNQNERNDVIIKTKDDARVLVRQIAGALAWRIRCWVVPGQYVHGAAEDGLAEKFGMIRFGSRVEIFLPDHVKLADNIRVGTRVYGGQTVVGWMP